MSLPLLGLSLSLWLVCPSTRYDWMRPSCRLGACYSSYSSNSLWNSTHQVAQQMKCFCCYGQWRIWQWIWKYADDSTLNSNSSAFRRGNVSITAPTGCFTGFPMMQGFHLEYDVKLILSRVMVTIVSETTLQSCFSNKTRINFFVYDNT